MNFIWLKIIISYILKKEPELKKLISIDIYSDTICPWCYIGYKKFISAIKSSQNNSFEIIWRPFQLNPDLPTSGIERQMYLEDKFGGKQNAINTYNLIYKTGLKNNIHFQFEKIKITPNTFASHKLLALSYKYKKQNEILESLFYAYFIEGINIGSIEELCKIASQHNILDHKTLNYLQSEEDKKNLLAEELQAREFGITGVPCFIINKEHVIFGAQDENIFLNLFNQINK